MSRDVKIYRHTRACGYPVNKRNFFPFFLISVWILGSTPTFAKESTLKDFASGYEIITDGSAAIYRLPLPENVYQTVVRPDLGDLRVFNKEQKRVPHAIRRPELKEGPVPIGWLDIPFFPLEGSAADTAAVTALDVTINQDGRIMHIKYKDDPATVLASGFNSYLIDLSQVEQDVDALEFDLGPSEKGYLKTVTLEQSDDLNRWGMLVSNAGLSELVFGGHKLKKNIIELPSGTERYVRFTWQGDSEGIRINAVRARFSTTAMRAERQLNVSSVTGTVSKKNSNHYLFDTGGQFPVSKINIRLPEDNTLVQAVLKSRSGKKQEWRTHYTGMFYRLNMQGTQLEGGSVSIRPTTDRYWQLEVSTEDGMGSGVPALEFTWEPIELYFLARGRGPYMLAYGNADADAPGQPVEALMRVLGDEQTANLTGVAKLGPAIPLKGDSAREPSREIPWQRIFLWFVLVSGVLVIGFMSFRLFRQMNPS